MPKISYQEIVTPDVSEGGTVLHEWICNGTLLAHFLDGKLIEHYEGRLASLKWKQLCQSK